MLNQMTRIAAWLSQGLNVMFLADQTPNRAHEVADIMGLEKVQSDEQE